MLMIDDNMFKLAKMQESLLKVATGDRSYHLSNYIKNIKLIDANAFDDLVNIMNGASKYNQTLEDELLQLEKIRKAYDQLLELQMKFKSVCEQYGEYNLVLSDLSILNIEYVDNRINVINGYLINIKNIEKNKNKLEELNEKLVSEEKKREFLSKKILLFEKKLRDDFVHASLKQVVFGKLESFDIISEYANLGYDVINLLDDSAELDNKYRNINVQSSDVSENYEAAKLCYNNLVNDDSKSLLNEIEREFYLVKYKHVMLKILKLLVNDVETCDLAKSKRENLIELINNRSLCLEKLGINNPLNIINVIDIDSQMKEIINLSNCINDIHSIRKEIGELSNRTEIMINENNNYLIALSDTKELILSKVGFNDVDITTFDDIVVDEVKSKKVILDNQVVNVRSISPSFRLILSKQKASGVITRICKMNLRQQKVKKGPLVEEIVPELVIGPKEDVPVVNMVQDEVVALEPVDVFLATQTEDLSEIFIDNASVQDTLTSEVITTVPEINGDIFETTIPFEEPVMFVDRTDSIDNVQIEQKVVEEKTEEDKIDLPLLESQDIELMPDAFWVADNNIHSDVKEESVGLSFDEQISALLAETQEEVNTRKR